MASLVPNAAWSGATPATPPTGHGPSGTGADASPRHSTARSRSTGGKREIWRLVRTYIHDSRCRSDKTPRFHITYVLSNRLVNEFRVGYNRMFQYLVAADQRNIPEILGISGTQSDIYPGPPTISIAGYNSTASLSNTPNNRLEQTFVLSDDVFYALSNHALGFGTGRIWSAIRIPVLARRSSGSTWRRSRPRRRSPSAPPAKT